MEVRLNFTEDELSSARGYASLHSLSLEDAIKYALFEQMEDEYDREAAEYAYQEYEKSGFKSRPFEEFVDELGIV